MSNLRALSPIAACVFTAFALVLGGCAQPSGTVRNVTLTEAQKNERQFDQQKLALSLRQDARNRLQRVAYPLLKGGEPWCGSHVAPDYGWQISSLHSYEESWRRAAREQLGVRRRPTVIARAPGGPADRAGVKPGDVLLRLNGETLPENPGSRNPRSGSVLGGVRTQLRDSLDTRTLTLRRNGSTHTVSLQPVRTCSYRVRLEPGELLRDSGDESTIKISRNLVTFTRNEDELSVVLAHLVSHRMLNHSEEQFRNWISGVTVDMIAFTQGIPTLGTFGYLGNNRHTGSFEAEADYLALYLVARGGFSVERTPIVWQRLAAARPSSIGKDLIRESYYTSIIDPPAFLEKHPLSTKRFQVMEAAVQRIARQRESNRPLTPTDDIQHRLVSAGADGSSRVSGSRQEFVETNSPDKESVPSGADSRTRKQTKRVSSGPVPRRSPKSDTSQASLDFEKPNPGPLTKASTSRVHRRGTRSGKSNSPDGQSVLVDGSTVPPSELSKPGGKNKQKPSTESRGRKGRQGRDDSRAGSQSSPPSRSYTIQVGSYLNETPALKQKKALRSAGFAARTIRTAVHGTNYYRVTVGTFSSRQEARSRAQQLTASRADVSSCWVRPRKSSDRDQTVLRGES